MDKIGIIAFSPRNNGGTFQYTQSLIDALIQDKKNEYVIFTDHNDLDRYQNLLTVRHISQPALSVFQKILKRILLYLNIRKPFIFNIKEKEIFADIDFFISPTTEIYPHFWLDKPYIVTFHDLQEKYYRSFFTKGELKKRRLFNMVIARTADHILCESEYVKNDLIEYLHIKENKITVIQAPPPKAFLDISYNRAYLNSVCEKYSLPERFLFYPAQFWPHKNHMKLLEAFLLVQKKYPDVSMVFTGAKLVSFNDVYNKTQYLQLTGKVKFLGYVDYGDLPAIYLMSEMLVMPTLFESVSIPIYEAESLKVPVCCSNILALPEQVADSALLFDPENPQDIALAIEKLLSDGALRKDLGERGYARIRNFNHAGYSKKLQELIAGVFR